jgi:hypothetical protein
MKKLMVVLALLALAMLVSEIAVAAPADKVDVCHLEGNGSYHLINVSENALPAHLAHGDALPGDPVPGMPGYVFDDACNAVAEPILVWSSVMNFSGTGWGGWSCPPDHPNVIDGGVSKSNTDFVPADHPVVQGPAEPGSSVDGVSYPAFPHYTYGTGETGWVVHNGGTPQSLYIYVYCVE